MSQVEHRAERSFAIKGTLVFTAQRDQFTIMEDAYLVCEGKKVAGAYETLPDRYRQVDVLDMGGKFVIPGTCDIHVHASQASFRESGRISRVVSGTHGLTAMRFPMSPDSTILHTRNRPTPVLLSLFWLHRQRACAPMQRPAAKRQRFS